ncbi:MAG: CoA transferase [Verrucomicrobia bacterium]|nr:CoA transferase [Verrucomicrobiota bacterium]
MHQILDGVRVLDLTQFFSGPQATLFLAGLGAEVIRIDSPASAETIAVAPPYAGPRGVSMDRRSPDDLNVNYLKRARGKKAICIDLKQAKGVALFMRLVDKADVVIENFSVGVTERLGIDYAAIASRNPRVVYCSLTGYGSSGPDKDLKAYDVTVQAAAGLMSVTGLPGQPPTKAGTALSDAIAGTFAMSGVVAALYDRVKTGAGQFVDVSMVDCLFSLLYDDPIDWYERLGVPVRQGNRIMRFSPVNTYHTHDGWAVLGAATADQWHGMLKAIGRADLIDDPDWGRVEWRLANNDEVDELVQAWAETVDTAQAVSDVRATGGIAAAIHGPEDLAAWPHLRERGMYGELEHPTLGILSDVGAPGFPLKFSGAETGYLSPAPLPRSHTHEVFGGLLALDEDEIARLEMDGVI